MGSSVLPTQSASAPLLAMRQSSWDYDDSMHTHYAQVKTATGKGRQQRTELAGCDVAPHVALLDSHLRGHLELPEVEGKVDVKVLVDSGSGITTLSESSCGGNGRRWNSCGHGWAVLDLGLQALPLHLTVASEGGVACASPYRSWWSQVVTMS